MMRLPVLLVVLMSFAVDSVAGTPGRRDPAVSQACALPEPRPETSVFRPSQLVAPVTLVASGSILHFAARDAFDVPINDWTSTWRGASPKLSSSDYLRFLPLAADLSLDALGVEAKHCLLDRSLEAAWAYGLILTSGFVMKRTIDSPRPDGSGMMSFPSGHAGMAFAGAELVRIEYGWGWGAGAYAFAAGICATRLYDNEHWFSDLMVGAGMGILFAHAGEWLLNPTRDILGWMFNVDLSAAPSYDSRTGAVGAVLCFNF